MAPSATTPGRFDSLVDLLAVRARELGAATAFEFLSDGETVGERVTYAELDARARAVAALLAERGALVGDRVLMLFPPGLDFVGAFFGCLYAGATAVPVYPPEPARLERGLPRIRRIASDAGTRIALTAAGAEGLRQAIAPLAPELGGLSWIGCDEADEAGPDFSPRPAHLAMLQYTSGSTSSPKGVMLEHSSLLHNLGLIHERFEHGASSRGVIWLPPYHDMGLIGGILAPILGGFPTTLMSPLSFLERPARWLEAVSRAGGTTSGGPNFAYELCCRKLTDADLEGLDLSSWKVAFCGAEPIAGETLRRFSERFARVGFREEAFYACYGLAEATLLVCGGRTQDRPRTLCVEPRALEHGAVERCDDPQRGRTLVGSGSLGLETVIVDPETSRRLAPDRVGEIWVRGDSVANGYWRRTRETGQAFCARLAESGEGHFLRTGDLGFVRDGELYVTGRLKDLIIVRGRNLAPQDVEATVASCHAAMRLGCIAAFATPREKGEGVAVVAEVRSLSAEEMPGVIEAVRCAIAREHDVAIDALALVAPRSVPKTTSGKLQRFLCRERLLAGELETIARWDAGSGASEPGEGAGANRAELLAQPAPQRRGPLLESLRALVASVLGGDPARISLGDPVVDYGLDSVATIELKDRIDAAFHVDVPLAAILDGGTVDGIADRILAALAAAPSEATLRCAELVPERAARHEPFPLNDLQQAYWAGRSGLFDIGSVSSHAYFEFESVDLDLPRAETAWNRLVERHDALRTIVRSEREQQILPTTPEYCIERRDLSGCDAEEVETRLREARERLSHRVAPLDRWPLFEIVAHGLPGGRTRLHVSLDYICADARSLLLLLRDWGGLSAAPCAAPRPLDLSFRDYSLWEARARDGEAHRRSLDYWLRRVPELPGPPDLPRVADPSRLERARFTRRTATLPRPLWKALVTRAREAGLTPSGVLLAAYAETLGAWSSRADFSVNVTHLTRAPVHPQVNEIAGQFASFTLVEAVGSESAPFRKRARALQQRLWEALDHRQIGGVRILRELFRHHGTRAGASMPVVFTCVLEDLQAMDWLGKLEFGLTQTPQVWIDHQVFERRGSLAYHWEVVEDLFPDGMIDQMFSAYTALLERLAESDGAWEDAAPLRAPRIGGGKAPLSGFVDGGDAHLPEVLVHDLFVAQALRRPHAAAVVSEGRTLTYAEVDRRSGDLARVLQDRGVGPDDVVAIVMRKGWEQVVAALAVLRAGGAYLPVDADLPEARLAFILADAGSQLALTQSALDAALPWPDGIERLHVDGDHPPARPRPVETTPDQLAYLLYTSGTSGAPKGAMLRHRGVVNALLRTIEHFEIEPDDRALAVTALHHDMSIFDVFGLLAAGGTLVIPDADRRREPAHWLELLERERVTLWNSVPATLQMLVEYAESRGASLPASLRLAFLGGDWIPLTLPDRARRLAPELRPVSVGGPTETTLWNIWYEIGAVDPAWSSIPYGRPIPNTRYYVLSEGLLECPTWVPGELYCAGPGVARGYWNRPEQTAERFVRHPRTGERLYRTGDLGRLLPDGNLEFLGRSDLQVKINGHRVELCEIESLLGRRDDVAAAVVVAQGERDAPKRLLAYVVPAPGAQPEEAALRAALRRELPAHMIPSRIVRLESLPLTPNGKVDRAELSRARPAPVSRSLPIPSGDATLERVAELLREALDLPEIDPDADLAELGANSIDLLRAANRLESEFGQRPTIDEFFQLSSVRALADYYAERGRTGPQTESGAAEQSIEALVASFDGIVEPEEREAFRVEQHGIRRDLDADSRELPAPPASLELRDGASRSVRRFADSEVALASLAQLLAVLRPHERDGEPHYRYASGGGLYPVQVYLHVAPGRVAGLDAGVYYYRPDTNQLQRAGDLGCLDPRMHWPANRATYECAAFGLYLVADLQAIAPLYGGYSRDLCLLEAGSMAQLLRERSEICGVGLCQIGYVDAKRLVEPLALGTQHLLVTSLLGGVRPEGEEAGSEGHEIGLGPADRDDSPLSQRPAQLARHAVLDADIHPRLAAPAWDGDPRRVLLTGATGFLGAFLVRELCAQTRAQVVCLVRARGEAHGLERIREALGAYDLWSESIAGRLVALPGDLAEARLGLSEDVYARLADEVDAVYHNGGWVNWVYPYRTLAGANVDGTRETLRLACTGRLKRYHFTSSLAVFPFTGRTFGEDDSLEHCEPLEGGYPQSKWVAERLVAIARERGLPASIYRPATITGDADTGAFNESAYIECMIKGSIQHGAAPNLDSVVEMVPVDYVARALVHLSRQPAALGGNYHLNNPASLHLRELVSWMRAAGYDVSLRAYDAWKRTLLDDPTFEDNALYPFAPFLTELREDRSLMAPGDCRNTEAGLAGSDIRCPVVDDALLRTYFDRFVKSGFLAAPDGGGPTRRGRSR